METHDAVRVGLAAAFGLLACLCARLVALNCGGKVGGGGGGGGGGGLQAHAQQGWRFRVRFHRAMLLAAVARTASLVVEVTVDHREGHSLRSWWNELVHALPAFLFFTTYSLLILLWAQLVHALGRVDAGGARGSLLPYYVALNALVYAVFLGSAGVTAVLREYRPFPRLVLYTLGVVDALAALGFVLYGARVARTLWARDDASIFRTRHRILRRVVVICAVCTAAFLFRGVYSLLVATGAVSSFYAVHGIGHAAWEATFLSATELVPSAVTLALTLQRDGGGSPSDYVVAGSEPLDRQGRLHGDYPAALLSVAEDDLDDLDAVDGGAFTR